jgi:cysteine synthase B
MTHILDIIGNTPLVEVTHLHDNKKVKIYVKLEGQNPGGSVKDRAAYSMIKGFVESDNYNKDTKLIEATSGNTGIALAMIAQQFDLSMTLVMPDNATQERILTMKAYGAKVILTPAKKTIEYSRDYALNLAKNSNYFVLNQFENDDNWKAHYRTTGPEIWQASDKKITHFVSAMGTTGTIMGVSKYLKEQNKTIQIVGTQPEEGSRIPGIRRWSPEFLPKIFDAKRVDKIIDVSQEEATQMMRDLAKKESIFCGMSSGGAMKAAVKLANTLKEGVIVTVACDRGDRYLSSGIFE